MDEQKLLHIIMELTRENERLILKLEEYEGKCTNEKKYTKQELRNMIFSQEEKENNDDSKKIVVKKVKKDLF